MKKTILIIVLTLSIFVCKAQSEDPICRQAFENAKKVYLEKGRDEGKKSFDLLFDCGDDKISAEAIEWLKNQEKQNNKPNNKPIKKLFSCLQTLEGHSYHVLSVSYSPDGTKIISGSLDKTIKIWDANTGQCLKTLEGHSDCVLSVSFSPNGKYIVSGGSKENPGKYFWSDDKFVGEIKIWDANTGECLKTLEGHRNDVESVAYSPDGTKIISGSVDKTIKIWGEK